MNDQVNHPKHYTSSPAKCSACRKPIECIDVVQHMSFPVGAAVKYLWRLDLKEDSLQDLRKSIWYLECEISRREKERLDKAALMDIECVHHQHPTK